MKESKRAATKQATTPETPIKDKKNFWNKEIEVDPVIFAIWLSLLWLLTVLIINL